MELLEALRGTYLSEGLSDEQLNGLRQLAQFVEFDDMQDIVRANEVSFDLYVLIEGNVQVTTEGGDMITRLKPGAIIGEYALFEDGERSATVMSNGKSTLVHLDGQKLLQHMEANPTVGMMLYRNFGRTLCERLRSANIQIERLVSVL